MYLCVYARAQYKGSFCLFGFFLKLVPSTLHTFTYTHTHTHRAVSERTLKLRKMTTRRKAGPQLAVCTISLVM